MSDTNTNVASPTEAPALKSTDTSSKAAAPKVEPVKAPPKPVEAKPAAPKATPESSSDPQPSEGAELDAASAAPPAKKTERLPRWVQERMERERQVTAARTREALLRELQESGKLALQPQSPSAHPQGETEKTLEDFDFDQARYQKYLAKQAIEDYKREETERAEQQKQAAVAEERKAKVDAFEVRVGAGAWDDILESPLNQDPKFKPLVDLFFGADDHDLDIAHHLALNPAEADRLLALPVLKRAQELAKLSETFSGEAVATPAVVPAPVIAKKTTNAPPPPKTLNGSGKPAVDITNPEMSTQDRIAAWRKARAS